MSNPDPKLESAIESYLDRPLEDPSYPGMVAGDIETIDDVLQYLELGFLVFDGESIHTVPELTQNRGRWFSFDVGSN